jgi:hypothetical protein
MGVEDSKFKKKFLKKKFSKCYIYYPDHPGYANSLDCLPEEIHLFDGSIDFEESLQQTHDVSRFTTKYKKRFGDAVFNTILKKVLPYINRCRTTYFVLDLDKRPPMKDVDLSRSYDPNARLFCGEVSDKNFPLFVDPRDRELKSFEIDIKRGENQIQSLQNHCARSDISKREKKQLEREIKLIEEVITSKRRSAEELKTLIACNPVDVWKDGKGVPENRKNVYGYCTEKFSQRFRRFPLLGGHSFYLDGAIQRRSQSRTNEYTSLWFFEGNSPLKVGLPECTEGEQAVMARANSLVLSSKPEKFQKFVFHSTDTDFYFYGCVFVRVLDLLGIPSKKKQCFTITKNFYAKKNWDLDTRKNYIANMLKRNDGKGLEITPEFVLKVLRKRSLTIRQKSKLFKGKKREAYELLKEDYIWRSKVYTINHNRLVKKIYKRYKRYTDWPVLTYLVFWGIVMGCDFIKGFRSNFQKPTPRFGLQTPEFLEFWFDGVLKRKNTLLTVRIVDDKDYSMNKRVEYKINVKEFITVLEEDYYRKKLSSLYKLSIDQKVLLVTICLNAQHIAGYMTNHYRKKYRRDQITPDPHAVDKDGCSLYGYMKDPVTNKTIQCTNIPKVYIPLVMM